MISTAAEHVQEALVAREADLTALETKDWMSMTNTLNREPTIPQTTGLSVIPSERATTTVAVSHKQRRATPDMCR